MTSPAAALDPLAVFRYRARFVLRQPMALPADQLGIVLRGAFGLTLRRLVCHDLSLACAACPLRGTCAYPAVFEPAAREGGPAIARIADPPRPFVLRRALADGDGVVYPQRELDVDLHIVGRGHAEAPLLLATLQRIADDGFGPGRAALSLARIEAIGARERPHATALDPQAARLSVSAPPLRARDLLRPGDEEARCVRIRFVSPTLLRDAGVVLQEPRFGALVRRLRARLGALATIFGEAPLGDDARAVGAAAEPVALVSSTVAWRGMARRSTRTGQVHPLEGFVGEAVYEGELGPFLPMLRMAELIHLGKHATFGSGRVAVDVLG